MDKEYFRKLCEHSGGKFYDISEKFGPEVHPYCVIENTTVTFEDDGFVRAFYSEELPTLPSYYDIQEVIFSTNGICKIDYRDNKAGLICDERIKLTGREEYDRFLLDSLTRDIKYFVSVARSKLGPYGV